MGHGYWGARNWHYLLPVLGGHGLELEVPVDDAKDIELLAFVLVHALDLNIKQGAGVDADAVDLQRQRQRRSAFNLHSMAWHGSSPQRLLWKPQMWM